jgi:hypothetical protein
VGNWYYGGTEGEVYVGGRVGGAMKVEKCRR